MKQDGNDRSYSMHENLRNACAHKPTDYLMFFCTAMKLVLTSLQGHGLEVLRTNNFWM
jgi:hypothetical protein